LSGGDFLVPDIALGHLRRMVYASLLAALTAAGGYIQLPIGPVPIVLQNLFVLVAGLILGPRWGLTSMGIYLLLGLVGFPVFAGGKGGLAHLMGPTGGYLLGFLLAAWISGWIADRPRGRLFQDVLAVALGSLAIYAVGVPWLSWVAGLTWGKALWVGMVPFLAGDALKASAAVVIARAVRPVLGGREKQPCPR
jgi:biotin transport system substrate-specific component